MGWKTKYGLPITMAMEMIGIKSIKKKKKKKPSTFNKIWVYKTDWKFKNQYLNNIIAYQFR